MEDYYKILELQPGASQEEIKKAYFRLVRQHRPEREPERFQEIRRAYELLKTDKKELPKSLALRVPQDPMGQRMFQQVEESFRQKNYSLTIRTAEEGIRIFGPCSGYVYFLALAQRIEGQTGKSVKNLESLTEDFPENVDFQKELALSFFERGYGKKAFAAFEKAYKMGCRDSEFLLNYGLCCEERGCQENGIQVLKELIQEEKRKNPREIEVLLNAYCGLLSFGIKDPQHLFEDTAAEMSDFLTESGVLLEPHEDDLFQIVTTSGVAGLHRSISDSKKQDHVSLESVHKAIGMLLKTLRKVLPDAGEEWDEAEKQINILAIQSDPDLSDAMKAMADVYYDPYEEYLADSQFYRFIQTDCRLCVLEEWPENKKELELLKERYPEVYNSVEEVVRTFENTNIDRLRDMLLKDYDRLDRYYSGYYYKKYPHRKPGQNIQAWDSDMEGTFRRAGKKIGRNDPCPCGSGKKYKNCCGRNR